MYTYIFVNLHTYMCMYIYICMVRLSIAHGAMGMYKNDKSTLINITNAMPKKVHYLYGVNHETNCNTQQLTAPVPPSLFSADN